MGGRHRPGPEFHAGMDPDLQGPAFSSVKLQPDNGHPSR